MIVDEDADGKGTSLDIFGAGLARCTGFLTVDDEDIGWLRPDNGVTSRVTRCHRI